MKYNGQELEPITAPHIFNPPKEMLVWDEDDDEPKIREVWGIAPSLASQRYPVMGTVTNYKHCAEIPEPKRATNRELSKWITQYGELTYDLNTVYHEFSYNEPDRENPVTNGIFIRKWEDTDWHEPTVDYMGMWKNE